MEFSAYDLIKGDLRDPRFVEDVIDDPFDEFFQLAADMGCAGFIFSRENVADIMRNSAIVSYNKIDNYVKGII